MHTGQALCIKQPRLTPILDPNDGWQTKFFIMNYFDLKRKRNKNPPTYTPLPPPPKLHIVQILVKAYPVKPDS